MAVTFGLCLSSCSSDDDEDSNITEEFLAGCFWDECDANGNLRNDQTEMEVIHLFFYSYGEGTMHTYNNGKLSAEIFSWSLKGDMLTISQRLGTDTMKVRYRNGILQLGDIFYKKRTE